MKIQLTIPFFLLLRTFSCIGQADMTSSANTFLKTLDPNQLRQAQFPFDSSERFVWHYIPKNDRKGISINELSNRQKEAAFALMRNSLSEQAYKKASAIMQLEKVLKAIEGRPESDHFRDPGKYFFTVFGAPTATSTWGWRLDGHHISFNFTSNDGQLRAGTPGFLGANPAVVLTGPEKGLEILKEENELAFELLHALNENQLKKAVVDQVAPGDIITVNSRKAMIDDTRGLGYSDMDKVQKAAFIKLLSLYIHRYTKLFSDAMMKDIEAAGLEKLIFAWEGSQEDGPGHKRYYRIKGPTIIIEYDNTQNDGNHVHSVIRDLKHDFGGDELLQHYKRSH